MKRSVLALAFHRVLAALAGCKSTGEVDETAAGRRRGCTPRRRTRWPTSTWDKAIKYLEKLEARYPYGRYAQQAQLEIAYAYWKDGQRASAIAAADRFIKLYPNHPNVDYAYYLKGLVNFNETSGLFSHHRRPGHDRARPEGRRASRSRRSRNW